MSEDDINQAYTDADLQIARECFAHYVQVVHRYRYLHARHTLLICDYLEKVESGEIRNLIITMPPRHGKSMTVTETFPSWFIGRKPSRRVIVASYSDRLAHRFGRMNKDKIRDFGQAIFNVELPEWGFGATGMLNWSIAGDVGGMISSTIGGSITGEGADLLLIDDPVKNREEADSSTYREKIWDEWHDTLKTRLSPEGRVVIILTRWHEDDLVGRILSQPNNGFVVLSLPCIAEDNDLLGRKPGEALWPEFGFDERWAESVKSSGDINLRTWNALYQQHPSSKEGSILKRDDWKFYTQLPELTYIVQSWDTAFKEKQEDDPSARLTVGTDGKRYYLLNFFKERLEFPPLLKKIQLDYYKDLPNRVLIEDAASGQSAIQVIKKETDIPVHPIKVDRDKIARANAISGLLEAGLVYLPAPSKETQWVSDYIDVCAKFPSVAHDEEVDVLTQALNYLRQRNRKKWIVTDEEMPTAVEETKIPEDHVKVETKDSKGHVVQEEVIHEDEFEEIELPRYTIPQPKKKDAFTLDYFDCDFADPADMLLRTCKEKDYVPQTCLQFGKTVIETMREKGDACIGCECDRAKCKGRYASDILSNMKQEMRTNA